MRTDYIDAVHEHSQNMADILKAAIKIKYEEIAALEAAIRSLEYVRVTNQPTVSALQAALNGEAKEEETDAPLA